MKSIVVRSIIQRVPGLNFYVHSFFMCRKELCVVEAIKIIELHPELVFVGRYWSVFLGMYDTITKGNLGQYVCSRGTYVGMTPFRECPELQLGSRNKNKTHPGGKAA